MKQILSVAVLLGGVASVASAAPVAISNFSFEAPLDNGTSPTSVNGVGNWTSSGGGQDIFAYGPPYATNGTTVAYSNGPESALYQRVGSIQAGTYTFKVDIGSAANPQTTFFEAYAQSASNSFAQLATVNTTPAVGTVAVDTTISFLVPLGSSFIGQTLQLQFVNTGVQSTYDNVRGDFVAAAAVPEPAAIGVLALGGLAALRRRRTA